MQEPPATMPVWLVKAWRVDAESVRQILKMFLFLSDYFAQHFSERVFAHLVGLPHPLAIIDQRLPFIFQNELEHVDRFIGHFDFLGLVSRCAIKIIDLLLYLPSYKQLRGAPAVCAHRNGRRTTNRPRQLAKEFLGPFEKTFSHRCIIITA